MTDFVGRILRPERNDCIIRSLLDVDFYKFTMGQFIFQNYRGTQVRFTLINRHLQIPIADLVDEAELRRQLDHVRTLRFTVTDMAYLRGQNVYQNNMFSEEYLNFLRTLQLGPYNLERKGAQYRLTFPGSWEVVTFWETVALAIISELLYRKLMSYMSKTELAVLYGRATDKLYRKLKELKQAASIVFADFSQRRRHGFLWQLFAIGMAREVMGPRFTGTSNTWMAFNQDLTPVGTNAHELQMVAVALAPDEEKIMAQYRVLLEWEKLYGKGLRIMLTDTYGSEQFFANMPPELAKHFATEWRGMRQDSGDPLAEEARYRKWLQQFGVDPVRDGKLFLATDGLDVSSMLKITAALGTSMPHGFGWGTMFGNDFLGCHPRGDERAVVDGRTLDLTWSELFRGHSIVCKIEEANGEPCVKISNNTSKATGPKDAIERYIARFGAKGRITQKVFV